MKTTKIIIEKPTEEVIRFFRAMRAKKEERKEFFQARRDIYFPKTK